MEVVSNDCTFSCKIEGPEAAPWVTLAHGLANDLTLWDGVVPHLAKRYRVLRYDARGHGASASPGGEYSFDMLVRDAVGILDALRIERTHFAGLSLGGMTAMGLALDHPARLSSAIVCDARAAAPVQYQNAWTERAKLVREKGVEAIIEPSIARWLTPEFQAGQPAALDAICSMVRRTSINGYCGAAAALRGLDYERRLGEIGLPVLFLVGSDDQGAPASVMKAMHERTPGSRFVEIARAGHLSAVEQPDAVASAILGFLDRVEAGAQTGSI